MKIWFNYGSEHSMNLVLIGHFKNSLDAKSFVQNVENLKKFLQENPEYEFNVLNFEPSVEEYLVKEHIAFLSPEQLNQILSYDVIKNDGAKIEVTSDEFLDGLIAWMIMKGAKVEIFSLHDYPGEK